MEDSWRWVDLNSNYEMKEVPSHGPGLWPVHKKTGELCQCAKNDPYGMVWNEEGTRLYCPICNLEGT